MALTNYLSTIEQDRDDALIIYGRSVKLRDRLYALWPDDLPASVSFDPIGKNCIRAFIRLPSESTEEITKRAVGLLIKHFGKTKRFLRENEGKFAWRGDYTTSDEAGEYEELVFIENAHPQECKLIEVEETRKVFKSICPGDEGFEQPAQGAVP